jgi:hypothetical protein
MVELSYVRKRRRKKAAIITSSVCAGGLAVLMIVAFLGYRVGSFTVKLRQTNVKLALTQDSISATDGKTESQGTDTKHNTTYLMVSSLPAFEVHTDGKLQNHDTIDNEDTDYTIGALINPKTGNTEYLYYFKYTFFVKNIGSVIANYTFDLRISENQRPTNVNSYGYDDLLRVRLYENSDDQHNYETYAKPARSGTQGHINDKGEMVYDELIASTSDKYATSFIDDTLILEREITDFNPGEFKRYTILTWLEGTDPQCDGQAPSGGSIKLEIGIEAHESRYED